MDFHLTYCRSEQQVRFVLQTLLNHFLWIRWVTMIQIAAALHSVTRRHHIRALNRCKDDLINENLRK
jgi:hypothetical protein